MMSGWSRMCFSLGLVALAAGLWVMAATSVQAAPNTMAGRVESYVGRSSDFELRRQGRSEPIAFFMPLYSGDVLRVIGSRAWVKIRLVNGSRRVLRAADGSYTVRARGRPAGSVSNALKVLGEVLTNDADIGEEDLITRGPGDDPIEILLPGFTEGRATVGDGHGRFALAWYAFAEFKSFDVTMTGARGRTVLTRRIGARKIDVPLNLTPGSYEITIASGREEVRGRFAVVDASKVPEAPASLVPDDTSVDIAWLAKAAWLAQQDEGRWALEAYLLLTERQDQFRPAGLLANRVAAGDTLEAIGELGNKETRE